MKCEAQFDIEAKVRQDCYNRGYEAGRKNPAEEIVEYIEKLQKQVKEYQDKMEQGLMIELPCKVGDTVYLVINRILECTKVWQVKYNEFGFFVSVTCFYPCDFELGEFVFLTREEAEAKLLELKGGKE